MISSSDLLGLRVLAAVVKEGTVQAAADRLSITQSAVSNALAKLRISAGDPLLVRVGNRSQPTQKARQLAETTLPFLDDAKALLHANERIDPAKLGGRFTIGMPDYLEQLLAPPLFSRLRTNAPKTKLAFRRTSAESANDLIDAGDIDLALTRIDHIPSWQHGDVIIQERFVVIYAKATLPPLRRLSLDEFVQANHAMVSFTTRGEGQIDRVLRQLGRSRQVVVTASSFSALADIVQDAPLIASVPHPVGYRLCQKNDLHVAEIGFPVPAIDVTLLHSRIRSSDPALQWVMQQIRDTVDDIDAF